MTTQKAILIPVDLWAKRQNDIKALVDEGAVVIDLTEVRWCATHDSQMDLKDACGRKMMVGGGLVNLREQMEGPQPCQPTTRLVGEAP